MLKVSSGNGCRLIERARAFHAREVGSFQEFQTIIAAEPDQQFEVAALLWLGRGDFTEEEWRTAEGDVGLQLRLRSLS